MVKDYTKKSLKMEMNIDKAVKLLYGQAHDCAKESLALNKDGVRSGRHWLVYTRLLALAPMQSNSLNVSQTRAFLERHSLPYYRFLESLKILDDALMLALSGRYLTAGSALRTSLESMIRGIFLYGLLDDNRRIALEHKVREHKPCKGQAKQFGEYVENLLQDPVNREGTTFEVALELELMNNCLDYRLPTFKSMFAQIKKWGFFGPLSDWTDIVYEYYKELCGYVHAARSSTSYSEAIIEKKDYDGFVSGKVDGELFEKFIRLFNLILNAIGTVFFTVVKDVFTLPGTVDMTRWYMKTYRQQREKLSSMNLAVEYAIEQVAWRETEEVASQGGFESI